MGESDHLIYAIVGADPFLRRLALSEVLARLDGTASDLGPTMIDGDAAVLAEVLDEVRTASLLGDVRIVIVDDADSFISRHRDQLERYSAQPSPTGVLILLCKSLPANTRLHKAIKKTGEVIKCEPPTRRALVGWVVDRAAKVYGKKVAPGVVELLREQIGEAPGMLDAELSKLATFVDDRPEITRADVDALTGHSREEVVFGVIDSILAGETGAALELWRQVVAPEPNAGPKFIGGLAAALRRWLQARRMVDSGRNLRDVLRAVWLPNAEHRLGRVSTTRLEAMQKDLLAAELSSRTGVSDVPSAIEKWIVTHSAGKAAAVAR